MDRAGKRQTEMDTRPGAPMPDASSEAYELLTCYGFAQHYVEGKRVVDVGRGELGYGTRLLAQTAYSVTGLTDSSKVLELASNLYTAPNVSYQRVDLPEIPYPEGHFDAAVAFEVIEELDRPEDLLSEAKRILKPDGILILSTPDKQTHSNDRNRRDPAHRREMYVPELREMLERHFERVELYRQGAVAGALIYEDSENLSAVPVKSASFYAPLPSPEAIPPVTPLVVAVCSDAEISVQENQQPYLLLDRERRVFDECAELREDVELLREEILHMQATEVQTFHEALEARNAEIASLKAHAQNLETHIRNIESSRAWRLLSLYRRLRTADRSGKTE